MRNWVRTFVALWYLLGWISHVYLGLFSPEIYRPFGSTALIPAYRGLWEHFVMPHITIFALLLAAFEIAVGCLLVSKGKWVKIGLAFSIAFNLFLIQMGLGFHSTSWLSDVLVNRLPNLIFIALQIPLFRGWDERSVPAALRTRFSRGGATGR